MERPFIGPISAEAQGWERLAFRLWTDVVARLRGSLSWTRVTPLEIRNGQILVTKAVETDYSNHGVGSSEV